MRMVWIAALLALVTVSEAKAHEVTCMPRQIAVRGLEGLGEVRVATVVAEGGAGLIEVWTSRDGNATIMLITPRGAACVIIAGEGWRWLDQGRERDADEREEETGL